MLSDGASRPASLAVLSSASRPSLQDILSNAAPPPWTLGAFMAYLSQNHCLETLEFTMEAERYKAAYADVQMYEGGTPAIQWSQDAKDHVAALWQKLTEAYILPYCVREVNLPGPVRDRLLDQNTAAAPPHPSELDEAVQIVFDLMNDSVLLPFLDSAQLEYQQQQAGDFEELQDARQGRSRLRNSRDGAAGSGDEPSRSPKPLFLQLGRSRKNDNRGNSPSTSTDAADSVDLVDDNGSFTPPSGEPLTPPTTPPTSDWTFGTSPSSLQRAISSQSTGWKRVSAKLGLGRKSRSTRRNNTSNGNAADASSASSPSSASLHSDSDVVMPDMDHGL